MASRIISVRGRQVLDSRGNPTVEAEVRTNRGVFSAIVPSGASTGSFEALELRDGGKAFGGKGVLKAVANINGRIASRVKGVDARCLCEVDERLIELDGTPDKRKLGANAVLAVSMAVARSAAAERGIPLYAFLARVAENKRLRLPLPQFNMINGGKHAGIENDFQEHLLAPIKAKTFSEALEIGAECFAELKAILKKKFGASATLVADEGGFAPPLKTVEERFDVLLKAAEQAGHADKVALALDAASSEFGKDGVYLLRGKQFSSSKMISLYEGLARDYPLYSVEDGLAEDDWEGWVELNLVLGRKLQLVGDDLLVTNVSRIKRAVQLCACNALLLKPNQVGTVCEAIGAALLAKKAGWRMVVSHRSGETEDSFIADLAVALGASQCKFGAPCRGERTAKYNRLLRIEEELGRKAGFGLKS
ncbi:MAG: phosphopyruvate hydratase [Candidatus Micrarchaeia archaeon]